MVDFENLKISNELKRIQRRKNVKNILIMTKIF
jgi:hypothetical protein